MRSSVPDDPPQPIRRLFRALARVLTALLLIAQYPLPVQADHGGRPIGTAFGV